MLTAHSDQLAASCPFVRHRTFEELVEDQHDLLDLVPALGDDVSPDCSLHELQQLIPGASMSQCLRLRGALRCNPVVPFLPQQPEWEFVARVVAACCIDGQMRARLAFSLEICAIAAPLCLSVAISALIEFPTTCRGGWQYHCDILMSVDLLLFCLASAALFLSLASTLIYSTTSSMIIDERLHTYWARQFFSVTMPMITCSNGGMMVCVACGVRLLVISNHFTVAWVCFGLFAVCVPVGCLIYWTHMIATMMPGSGRLGPRAGHRRGLWVCGIAGHSLGVPCIVRAARWPWDQARQCLRRQC